MEERNPGQKSVFLPFYRPLLRLRQSHFFHHLTRKGEDGRASLEAEKQPQQKGRRAKKRGGSESTAFLKGPAGRRHSLFCAGGEAVFGWQLPTFALSGRKKCGGSAAATSTCTNERTRRGERELSAETPTPTNAPQFPILVSRGLV